LQALEVVCYQQLAIKVWSSAQICLGFFVAAFPQTEKTHQVAKPLERKKRIASRLKFKEFGANPTKTYRRRRYTDYQVMCQAGACRQRRPENATEAEEAFAEILKRLGVCFERERIVLNGHRWVLLDVWLPGLNLAIKLDGAGHRLQKNYDHGRSMWLARKGIKTVRSWNKAVLNGDAESRMREILGA